MRVLIDIFLAFFRVGVLGFGGGPTMIPFIHNEVVIRYKWMKEDEFTNVLAIGNTLPGPIATKMAGYIGYKVSSYSGMLIAIVAVTVPIVILLISGLSVLNEYRYEPWVTGMISGIIPIVAWMLTKLTWDFFSKGYKSIGLIFTLVMCFASFTLIYLIGIHPAFIIVTILVAAFFRQEKKS
ncbi:chromate transporter [Marinomonas dokdonensis]|uniref:chromate transporter n=1 Tax=Marinomonas dokdonensis TaxID=328224 RepID=UPI0040558413